jgi:hypothetical protein
MLLLMLFAEAATQLPHKPSEPDQRCTAVFAAAHKPALTTGFGWSDAAHAQDIVVSKIVATRQSDKTEPRVEAVPEGQLPEKAAPVIEPAMEMPKCTPEPPGKIKRRKNQRLS